MVRVWMLLALLLGAAACSHDSDCGDLEHCTEGTCKHKNLWPLAWQEYVGTFIIFLLLGLANASGLGGGVIMILSVLSTRVGDSVPNWTWEGGALGHVVQRQGV